MTQIPSKFKATNLIQFPLCLKTSFLTTTERWVFPVCRQSKKSSCKFM
ncbi:MAG: hypothetical protein II610_09500 [Treponema sp.]|nr:hypothetical protein [Treponema sp.]